MRCRVPRLGEALGKCSDCNKLNLYHYATIMIHPNPAASYPAQFNER